MNPRIRCTDCRHYIASVQRCIEHKAAIRQPRRWRVCTDYCGPRSVAEINALLADADLLHFVAELRDTPEGRLLRLELDVPEFERFAVYRMVGIKVREPERIHLRSKPAAKPATPSAQRQRNAA